MKRRSILWAGIISAVIFLATATAFTDEPGHEQTASAEDRLLEAAASIVDRVVEIRGLALLEPIDKGVQNRDELRETLIARFNEEVPQEVFEAEAAVYTRLGLFDPDLDYRQLLLDLYTEQIAGFYDQETKELVIMEGLPEVIQRPTMAHEIFHAIQDQHFDIGALLAPFSSQENGDFALARMALIEGDAYVLMFDFELYESGRLPAGNARSIADLPLLAATILEMPLDEMTAAEQLEAPSVPSMGVGEVPSLSDTVLGNAPPIVRDLLLFPYVGGMRFVLRARAGRSWRAFDEVYENPPVSTSQILHPERYFAGEYPLDIQFDASSALPDFEPIYETVFGELQTRSWLNTHFAEMRNTPSAAEIAAGWNGDRLHGFQNEAGDVVAVHLSTWRSVEEARAFALALEQTVHHRNPATPSVHTEGQHGESWCLRPGQEAQGERIYVERWGEMVLYIEGAPSSLDDDGQELDPSMALLREAVWDSHRRLPFEEILADRIASLEAASIETAEQESTEETEPLQ